MKSGRSSRSCYDPDYGKSARDGGQGQVGLFYPRAFTFICVVDSDKTKSDNAGHLLVVNILFHFLFSC